MVRASRQSLKMAENVPEEFPMSVQLAGCEGHVMAEAAKLNEDSGAAIIDINMGCPVKKVVNGHAGSALMRDLEHARTLLTATVKAVKLPVTLKMRTGWDDANRNAPELAKIAVVFFAALILERRMHRINDLSYSLLPIAIVAGVAVGLILLQPDFGTAVALLLIVAMMVFAAGLHYKYFVGALLVALPVLYVVLVSAPYRRRRHRRRPSSPC